MRRSPRVRARVLPAEIVDLTPAPGGRGDDPPESVDGSVEPVPPVGPTEPAGPAEPADDGVVGSGELAAEGREVGSFDQDWG